VFSFVLFLFRRTDGRIISCIIIIRYRVRRQLSIYIYIYIIYTVLYIIIFWCRRWNMFVLVLPVGPSIYYYNNIIIYYILRLLYFVHFRFTRTSCSKLCTPLKNENHNVTLVFSSHRRTPPTPTLPYVQPVILFH